MLEITLLPGERNNSTARSIKDAGQAVGYSLGYTYLCTPSAPNGSTGEAVDLSGLPDGLDASRAFGINAFGQVFGISYGMRANTHSSGRRRQIAGSGAMIDLGIFRWCGVEPGGGDQRPRLAH